MSLSTSKRTHRILQSEIRNMSIECERVDGINLAQGICDTEPPAVVLSTEEDEADVPAEAPAPTEAGTCLAGSPSLERLAAGVWSLTPVNLPEAPEEYAVLDFVGGLQTRQETYFFSWFSSVSGVGSAVSKTTKAEMRLNLKEVDSEQLYEHPDLGPTVPVWMVVRDGRGGTSWCESYIPFDG